jgi:hypothetical protein
MAAWNSHLTITATSTTLAVGRFVYVDDKATEDIALEFMLDASGRLSKYRITNSQRQDRYSTRTYQVRDTRDVERLVAFYWKTIQGKTVDQANTIHTGIKKMTKGMPGA